MYSDCDFKGYRESMKTTEKKIYLVDSGLSFNLPFPLVLRPQRGIQIYLTMDFSSRVSDSTPPFRVRLRAPPAREDIFGKVCHMQGFLYLAAMHIFRD